MTDLSQFDKFKKEQGKKWSKISVKDIKGQEDLILDDFTLFFYSAHHSRLDIEHLYHKIRKRITKRYESIRFGKVDNDIKQVRKMQCLDPYMIKDTSKKGDY